MLHTPKPDNHPHTRRRRRAFAIAAAALPLIAAAAGGLLSATGGCARAVVEGKAEKAIKDLLPQYLGPAEEYRVRVQGKTGAMLRGRLGQVHIEGKNVRLAEELTVADLTLDLRDVSVDRGAGRLQDVAGTTFVARISEADLNRYVGGRRPGLRDLRLSVGPDGLLTVRARPEIMGYPTLPVEIRGTLVPREGGAELDFAPDTARVSVVPIPRLVIDHLANRLNPVVDLSTGLALPIQVKTAIAHRGSLTLRGIIPSAALLRMAEQAVTTSDQGSPSREP